MEAHSLKGKVFEVFELVEVSDRFRKREFVVEVNSSSYNGTFIEYIKLQTVQDKCDLLDDVEKGDLVVVKWTLSGRKWGKKPDEKYFTNVNTLDISIITKSEGEAYSDVIEDQLPLGEQDEDTQSLSFPQQKESIEESEDDLPF